MMDFLNNIFIRGIIQSNHANDNINNKEGIKIIKKQLNGGVVSAGNNYLSEIQRLNVQYEIQNNLYEKSFIIKDPSHTDVYHLFNKYGLYDKECEIYNTVLPEMTKISQRTPLPFTKGFLTIYPQVIALEDLKVKGYDIAMNSSKLLPLNYVIKGLESLAEFHALSVKLNVTKPEKLQKVKKDYLFSEENKEGATGKLYQSNLNRFIKTVEKMEDRKKYVDSLLALKDKLRPKVLDLLKENSEEFNVLNHGDFWSNNIMFKLDEKGEVVHSKMIDYQLTRWCSPVLDIWFFLITSVNFETFHKHINHLFDTYIKTLNQHLELYDCGQSYSIEEIKDDFKDKASYGLFVMIVMAPILLCGPRDHHGDHEGTNTEELELDSFDKSFESDLYGTIVHSWLPYFEKLGVLQQW